jgi:hypothetical protein
MKLTQNLSLFLLCFLVLSCGQIKSSPSPIPAFTLSKSFTREDYARLLATTTSGFIADWQAIELAKLECANAHSYPDEPPYNIQTELLTWKEVQDRRGRNNEGRNPDLEVWFVSMEGAWRHNGPYSEEGTQPTLISERCVVTIDTRSGSMINLTN